MPELFSKFGGHRQAAGVTLDVSHLDEFRERFRAHAESLLTPADFEPALEIDAAVELGEIGDDSVAEVLSLAPFGFGNPPPLFVVRGVTVASSEVKKEKHLFARLNDHGRVLRVKAWNFADRAPEFAPGAVVDVVFSVEDDAYSAARGYAPWQAIIRDVRASKTAQAA
jgi:single-stranded-DNA-specific exonuclease